MEDRSIRTFLLLRLELYIVSVHSLAQVQKIVYVSMYQFGYLFEDYLEDLHPGYRNSFVHIHRHKTHQDF